MFSQKMGKFLTNLANISFSARLAQPIARGPPVARDTVLRCPRRHLK